MNRVLGYIICLDDKRQKVFERTNPIERRFSEAVDEFPYKGRHPLVCLIVSRNGDFSHIGFVKRGNFAATDLRRLNVYGIKAVVPQISRRTIENQIANPSVCDAFKSGGLLSYELLESILKEVARISPEVGQLLHQFIEQVVGATYEISENEARALGYQKGNYSGRLSTARPARAI